LFLAARRRRRAADAPPIPDTGSLRGGLLALLANANSTRNPMAALVSSMLGSYYNQTGPAPAEAREAFLSERSSGSAVQQVVDCAIVGGEVDPARLVLTAVNAQVGIGLGGCIAVSGAATLAGSGLNSTPGRWSL
jgi:Tetracyclin repressor-like, C-terminal domain